jgi:hypothetical protein
MTLPPHLPIYSIRWPLVTISWSVFLELGSAAAFRPHLAVCAQFAIVIIAMLRMPLSYLFSTSFSACLSFGGGWKHLKNSIPTLFSTPPRPPSPPNHPSPNLVLVVHGIGPQVQHPWHKSAHSMWTDDIFQEKGEDGGDFADNVKLLENLTLRSLHTRAGRNSSYLFRPVFWRTSFRSRISCGEQIALCSLPSLPRYRAFFNAAILDIFFYTSRALHASMLRDCAHQLNHE